MGSAYPTRATRRGSTWRAPRFSTATSPTAAAVSSCGGFVVAVSSWRFRRGGLVVEVSSATRTACVGASRGAKLLTYRKLMHSTSTHSAQGVGSRWYCTVDMGSTPFFILLPAFFCESCACVGAWRVRCESEWRSALSASRAHGRTHTFSFRFTVWSVDSGDRRHSHIHAHILVCAVQYGVRLQGITNVCATEYGRVTVVGSHISAAITHPITRQHHTSRASPGKDSGRCARRRTVPRPH